MNTVNIPDREGYLAEFKSFSGGLSVKELSITLCAFANSDGGDIYIGVSDSCQIKGVKITPELLDQIQNAAREGCSPPVPIKLKQTKLKNDKSVIKISTIKSLNLHSTAKGITYIRVGTQDKKVLGDELLRLAESKSQVSYEETPLQCGIDEIDLDILGDYIRARKIKGTLSPSEFLVKLGLAHKEKNQIILTAGAIILFGKSNSTVLLQRDFTFVTYDIEGSMYSYREDISLPAPKIAERILELIKPINSKKNSIKGMTRVEETFYPEEAIREGILNAIAHRDYRIKGLRNECRLYPDRLEIISAGSLPPLITLENIAERHYSRNPKIMHALLTMGLTEELGQGIKLIKKSLLLNGNPEAKFMENTDQFKVIFLKEIRNKNIKEIINQHFNNHEYLTRKQLETIANVSGTTAKKIIKDLSSQNIVKKIGTGPSTRYIRWHFFSHDQSGQE